MAQYHVNSQGNPGKCTAQAGGCPFGGSEDHFATKFAAQKAYETTAQAQAQAELLEQKKVIRKQDLKKGSTLDLSGALPQGADYVGKITNITKEGRIMVKPVSAYDVLPTTEVFWNLSNRTFEVR